MPPKKDKGLITPDDPEFQESMQRAPDLFKNFLEKDEKDGYNNDEALRLLKDIGRDQDSVKVIFQQKDYPRFHLECGIQVLSRRWSKIIMHLSKITRFDMETLAEYLAKNIRDWNVPLEADFSKNPEFRNHWDALIYTTNFEAPFLLDRLLILLDHYPKFRADAKSRSV
jgi:hypothetical protein